MLVEVWPPLLPMTLEALLKLSLRLALCCTDALADCDSLTLILKLRDAGLSFEVEVEAVIELLVEVFELELLSVEVL